MRPLATTQGLGEVDLPFVALMALLAFGLAAAGGAVHRLVMGTRSPRHLTIIVGVGGVGVWMNSAATLVEYVERTVAEEPVILQRMATNSAALGAALLAASIGARFGDRIGQRVDGGSVVHAPAAGIGTLVQAAGRVIVVEMPAAEAIEDIEGYEPVPAAAKEALGGATFRFPRGLTVEALRERVTDRIRDDFQVGHVDLEIDVAGEVTHLAVGSRAAGIGPTLPPRKVAVGIPTVTAPGASPGDRIRVWRRTDARAARVGPGELRAVGEGVATVVMNEGPAAAIDRGETYEIVTLRAAGRASLEFASLLRAANETLRAVSVQEGVVLDGLPVAALRLPVLGLQPAEGGLVPLPAGETVLGAGDTVYVVGRHADLRKLRRAAGGRAAPRGGPT